MGFIGDDLEHAVMAQFARDAVAQQRKPGEPEHRHLPEATQGGDTHAASVGHMGVGEIDRGGDSQ